MKRFNLGLLVTLFSLVSYPCFGAAAAGSTPSYDAEFDAALDALSTGFGGTDGLTRAWEQFIDLPPKKHQKMVTEVDAMEEIARVRSEVLIQVTNFLTNFFPKASERAACTKVVEQVLSTTVRELVERKNIRPFIDLLTRKLKKNPKRVAIVEFARAVVENVCGIEDAVGTVPKEVSPEVIAEIMHSLAQGSKKPQDKIAFEFTQLILKGKWEKARDLLSGSNAVETLTQDQLNALLKVSRNDTACAAYLRSIGAKLPGETPSPARAMVPAFPTSMMKSLAAVSPEVVPAATAQLLVATPFDAKAQAFAKQVAALVERKKADAERQKLQFEQEERDEKERTARLVALEKAARQVKRKAQLEEAQREAERRAADELRKAEEEKAFAAERERIQAEEEQKHKQRAQEQAAIRAQAQAKKAAEQAAAKEAQRAKDRERALQQKAEAERAAAEFKRQEEAAATAQALQEQMRKEKKQKKKEAKDLAQKQAAQEAAVAAQETKRAAAASSDGVKEVPRDIRLTRDLLRGALTGNVALVKDVLNGPSPVSPDAVEYTSQKRALEIAVKLNHPLVVKSLLDARADLSHVSNKDVWDDARSVDASGTLVTLLEQAREEQAKSAAGTLEMLRGRMEKAERKLKALEALGR
jgi:hypothetical protein